MKYIKFLLIFILACTAQVSVAQMEQRTKWDLDNSIFEMEFRRILLSAPTKEALICSVNSLQIGNGHDGDYYRESPEMQRIMDKNATERKNMLAQSIINDACANIPKMEERLAKGKSVNGKKAYMAALVFALDGNYKEAAKFFSVASGYNQDEINLSIVGCNYMLNKDKAAALDAMKFTKPTINMSDIAIKYQMYDIYKEKLQELLASKQVQLRRALRSKDYPALISFIPYDIPQVDSLFATNQPNIMIKEISINGYYTERDFYQVDDFSDRNIITVTDRSNMPLNNEGPNFYYANNVKEFFLNRCFAKHGMSWALSKEKLEGDIENGMFPYTYSDKMLTNAVKTPAFISVMANIWNDESKNGHSGYDANNNKLIKLLMGLGSVDKKVGYTMTFLSYLVSNSFHPDLAADLVKIRDSYSNDSSMTQFINNQTEKAQQIINENNNNKEVNWFLDMFKELVENL